MQRAKAGQPFTIEQKREELSAWYDELAKGPVSGKTGTSSIGRHPSSGPSRLSRVLILLANLARRASLISSRSRTGSA